MSKKKVYPDDDGHIIAPMNVEGMPWHQKTASQDIPDGVETKGPPLNRGETWRYTLHAMGAALLIALVFVAAGALFILFSQYVWLK